MYILTKAVISLLLGLILAIILGNILVPLFKKINISQSVSEHLNLRHLKKEGTPTMGGIIFVLTTIIIILILFFKKNLKFSYNFLLVIIIFLTYALLGFIDDFMKIKFKNNKGLSIISKFFIQILIAIIFFVIYMSAGNNTVIEIFNHSWDLKYFYGIFILLMLTGFSNAVNITDGLDGLAAGLCFICFITLGIIAFNSNYIIGFEEIAIFCFILGGSLLGFLFFNFHPARIFMGDLGSLSLGASLATIAIILKCEIVIFIIGLPFILEIISSAAQIIAIRIFKRKLFLKSPLHHHLEEKGFCEEDIIKIFYTFGLFLALLTLICFVWL